MCYLFEITTYTSEKPAYGCYPYDNETSARAAFHTKMGGAMKNDHYASEQLMVISDENAVVRVEKFSR